MKVIVVNDHLVPDGGADVAALNSAEALAAAGAEVTVFAADRLPGADTRPRPYRIVSTGQDDLARGHPIGAALQGLWNPQAARALRALLAAHDPADTVVHVHSWTKALSSSIFPVARRAGFKQLLTVHEYFSVCPSGMLFNSQTRRICTLKPMSAACLATHCDARRYAHKLYRVARHAVQDHVGRLPRHVDRFLTISRLSQQRVAEHLPPGVRFSPVRNPIEVGPQLPPADPGAGRAFAMVARMFAPKGWEVFLEACERAGVPALCIGEGPDRAALQARFPAAQFTGQLDRAGVVAAVRSARALVLPSRWVETQGMVIAEAAAHGIPGLASDVCGGGEAIEAGVNGFIFPNGDVATLAAQLRRLADDDALARRLGAEAYRRFWADPPTHAQHARELLQVYRELLDERAAVPVP